MMNLLKAAQVLAICAIAGAAYGQTTTAPTGSSGKQMDGAAGAMPGNGAPRDPTDCAAQEGDGLKQPGCADVPATTSREQRGGSMPSPGNPSDHPQTGTSMSRSSESGLSSGNKL